MFVSSLAQAAELAPETVRAVRSDGLLWIAYLKGGSGVKTDVECLQPFAAYQTLQGPVDSMGVYFRCRTQGILLEPGHETRRRASQPIRPGTHIKAL